MRQRLMLYRVIHSLHESRDSQVQRDSQVTDEWRHSSLAMCNLHTNNYSVKWTRFFQASFSFSVLSPPRYEKLVRTSANSDAQEVDRSFSSIDVGKKTSPVKGHLELIHRRALVSVEKLISSLSTKERVRIKQLLFPT